MPPRFRGRDVPLWRSHGVPARAALPAPCQAAAAGLRGRHPAGRAYSHDRRRGRQAAPPASRVPPRRSRVALRQIRERRIARPCPKYHPGPCQTLGSTPPAVRAGNRRDRAAPPVPRPPAARRRAGPSGQVGRFGGTTPGRLRALFRPVHRPCFCQTVRELVCEAPRVLGVHHAPVGRRVVP